MKTQKALKRAETAPIDDDAPADGRRMRSERSRRQIVNALLKLVREGDMSLSAAKVAETAGVSLRTVFRHFEEMDVLYREISAQMEAEIMPIVMQPFDAMDWRGRLDQLVARRAGVYERIMPMKVAASVRRFQSDYLMDDYNRFLRLERGGLQGILPPHILNDRVLCAALEMVTGFQAWRRMRQDQGLSADEAEEVMAAVVDRLVTKR